MTMSMAEQPVAASVRRSGDDITWAERYAVGLFVLVTPFSYTLCDNEANAVHTILVVNTLIAFVGWGLFRGIEHWRQRRAA
jgi:hypothetical protein